MVAVGLSAQALAHDVPAILTQINDHSRNIIRIVSSRAIDASAVKSQAQAIDSAADGVMEMIDFVQPMLRGKRASRQRAMISEFVQNFYELRGARLRSKNIHWHVEDRERRDFKIAYNTGRFIQVFDNLTTNSEYWIARRYRESKKGRIDVVISDPELIFWDNGPGVQSEYEETLFDLFVSGKPADEGNGLGLYITQQLLLRDNCSISMSPERNTDGRLFKFVINFSGVRVK